MKKVFFVLIVTSAFISCSKDHEQANTVNPVSTAAKVKTASVDNGVTTYTYDAQGRQTRSDYADGSYLTTEYSTGIAKRKNYNATGIYQFTETLELNADGYCIRETSSTNADETMYQYNPDKTLAKRTYHSGIGNSVFDYFYSNGNCDSIRITAFTGNWQSTIARTFYTDKPNLMNDENTGNNFYGKPDKNIIKSDIYHFYDGTSNTPGNYVYEYDAKGNVSKETRTSGSNIEVGLFTYY